MMSGGVIYVGDVRSTGLLGNVHVLAKIPGGGNDGGAVDDKGRIYVVGYPGVRVFDPNGTYLGTILAPLHLISAAFSGPAKKTLFAVGLVRNRGDAVEVGGELLAIQMIAQGYSGRAK